MSTNAKPTVPQAPDLTRDAGTKRKRGRPPNAQRRDAALDAPQTIAPAATDEYDADADDAGRPRKRGRPLRSVNGGGGAAEDGAPAPGAGRVSPRGKENRPLDDKADALPAQDARRKRGRPALGSREQRQDDTLEVQAVNGSARRRTLRQTHGPNGVEEAPKGQQPEVEPRKRRRARGRSEEPEPEPEPDPEPEPEQPMRRTRGRPSLEDQRELESVLQQQEEDDQPRLRRRRRPSIQEPAPAKARDKAPKTTAKSADTTGEAATESRKRRPKGGKAQEPSIEEQPQEQSKSKGRRPGKRITANTTESANDNKANGADADDGDAPPSPEKPYTHIAPHVHRVRQSEIKAKWTPLGEPSLASVSSILRLAHRPILQRLSNTQQRREHTAAALRLVTNRITHKISRGLPFPPPAMTAGRASASSSSSAVNTDDGARAAELDFEGVLDAKQALERQLDPALHAVGLLRREKERLERELEKDYEVLRGLDLSARAQGRDYRALVRRAHALAPAPETAARQNEDHERDGLVPQRQASSSGLFDNLQDEEEDVKDLGLQLGSHVESIRNNLCQTEGILPQLSRSRAALQDVLFRYLDQEQYEHVLFG